MLLGKMSLIPIAFASWVFNLDKIIFSIIWMPYGAVSMVTFSKNVLCPLLIPIIVRQMSNISRKFFFSKKAKIVCLQIKLNSQSEKCLRLENHSLTWKTSFKINDLKSNLPLVKKFRIRTTMMIHSTMSRMKLEAKLHQNTRNCSLMVRKIWKQTTVWMCDASKTFQM